MREPAVPSVFFELPEARVQGDIPRTGRSRPA